MQKLFSSIFSLTRKRYIRLALLFACIITVIIFIDFESFAKLLSKKIIIGIIVSQIPLVLGAIALGGRLSIYADSPALPLSIGCKAFFLGLGLNLVLPGRLSEFIKPIYFRDKAGVSLKKGLAAVFLERFSDLIIVCGLALTSAGSLIVELDATMTMGLFVILLLCLFSLPLLETFFGRLFSLLPGKMLRNLAVGMLTHCVSIMRQKCMYIGLGLGLMGWLASLASVWLFLYFVAPEAAILSRALTLFVATTFAYAIPALPGGIGTYEAGAVLVLKSFGYSVEEALLIGLSLHVAQVLPGIVGTTIVMTQDHTGISSLIREVKMLSEKREQRNDGSPRV